MLLLSCLLSYISRLEAAILDFWLPVTSDSIPNSTVEYLFLTPLGSRMRFNKTDDLILDQVLYDQSSNRRDAAQPHVCQQRWRRIQRKNSPCMRWRNKRPESGLMWQGAPEWRGLLQDGPMGICKPQRGGGRCSEHYQASPSSNTLSCSRHSTVHHDWPQCPLSCPSNSRLFYTLNALYRSPSEWIYIVEHDQWFNRYQTIVTMNPCQLLCNLLFTHSFTDPERHCGHCSYVIYLDTAVTCILECCLQDCVCIRNVCFKFYFDPLLYCTTWRCFTT